PTFEIGLRGSWVHVLKLLRVQPLRDEFQVDDIQSAVPKAMDAPVRDRVDMRQADALHDPAQASLGSFLLDTDAQRQATTALEMAASGTDIHLGILRDHVLRTQSARHFFDDLAADQPAAGEKDEISHAATHAHGQAARANAGVWLHEHAGTLHSAELELSSTLTDTIATAANEFADFTPALLTTQKHSKLLQPFCRICLRQPRLQRQDRHRNSRLLQLLHHMVCLAKKMIQHHEIRVLRDQGFRAEILRS